MKTEIIIHDEYGKPQIMAHESEMPGFEARIAISLVERWGLVAASPDGEDSAGRAKLRKLRPVELVTEACDTAAELVREFAERGWMIQLPSLVEHIAAKKAAEEKKDEERRRLRAQ